VDYRAFRQGNPEPARTERVLLPPLRSGPGPATEKTREEDLTRVK
jgi:hypothetical protein